MRKILTSAAAVALLAALAAGWLSARDQANGQPASDRKADEAAVRQAAEAFAKVFASGDAKAVAAAWTEAGEYIPDDGAPIRGRAALEKAYADFIAKRPKVATETKVESVRFLAQDTAVAEGTFTVRRTDPAGAAIASRFSALYVREGGAWKMALLKEWGDDTTDRPDLNDLAWLIGTWSTKHGDREATTTYEWADGNKKFLKAHFTIKDTKENKVLSTGTQVIGVDPAVETIRAWVFDADGGIGESNWSWDGERWAIDSAGTLADGSHTTALNFIRRTGDDSFTWQSVKRTEDGESLPDVPPIPVTRVKGAN
jgi:uncharacterized protein (TIGR02246 family)